MLKHLSKRTKNLLLITPILVYLIFYFLLGYLFSSEKTIFSVHCYFGGESVYQSTATELEFSQGVWYVTDIYGEKYVTNAMCIGTTTNGKTDN